MAGICKNMPDSGSGGTFQPIGSGYPNKVTSVFSLGMGAASLNAPGSGQSKTMAYTDKLPDVDFFEVYL